MVQNTKFGDVRVCLGTSGILHTHACACTDGNKHSSINRGHSKSVCS